MASESETLADIVAEIRAYGAQPPPRLMWLEIADRIEAASRRECESVGNAAAAHVALVKIHDLTNALDEKCGVDPVEIRDIARAALSAPPRQCDVGTAEEQVRRYKLFCENHSGWDGQKRFCCLNCPFIDVDECEFMWAQMPYETEEGEGDGR